MVDESGEFERRRLEVLRATGLLAAPPLPEFDEICQRARDYFDVPIALVTLIEADLQIVKAGAGSDLRATPRSEAFCDYTIRTDEVLVVPDATQDPRFATNPLVTGEPFIRFYAGAPLIYRGDLRLGALCLLDTRPRQFSASETSDLALTAEKVLGLILEHEFDTRFGGSISM